MKTKPLKLKVSHNYKNRINIASNRKDLRKRKIIKILRKKCTIVLIRLIKHLSRGFLETSTWVLFSSSSHFAPQKYFCGIKWDFDNLSWELDAAQIFFLLQLTSLLKMGGDRIMRHSIRGSGSIHKACSSSAETPNIKILIVLCSYYAPRNQALCAWF